ncbi:hypothetical protein ACQJ9K_07525 [Helicobacter pylori]|uniref:Uncharacterized protein n=4 Tax=Helicobacter pylori TaxID=210 RepID=A0A060CQJ8_HELPX|nr:hypothetical protein [Helicobacter pylori]EST40213.1 hypothetical protein N871_05725 [Helicobacter pylori X47-2AL]AIA98736.1 hypothetical protein 166_ICEHptfs4c_16 [Helicobacter pylori]AIA98846.1 hypothetical protein 175_ICEHptfs4c_16 [Helicobacter pylori]EPZ73743.1 hypothetical protein N206_07735 [Helicobacter pylori UM111]MCQ2674583.1 hypothetical protein [Helicobacter pylori]
MENFHQKISIILLRMQHSVINLKQTIAMQNNIAKREELDKSLSNLLMNFNEITNLLENAQESQEEKLKIAEELLEKEIDKFLNKF